MYLNSIIINFCITINNILIYIWKNKYDEVRNLKINNKKLLEWFTSLLQISARQTLCKSINMYANSFFMSESRHVLLGQLQYNSIVVFTLQYILLLRIISKIFAYLYYNNYFVISGLFIKKKLYSLQLLV